MKPTLETWASLSILWVFAANCAADDLTPELAVLKGEGVRVNRIAFSADGSRLAAAMNGWVDKDGKAVAVPGKAIVWDVDHQQQVCICSGPKSDFTHIWMSADGKSVVTADHGITNLNGVYHEWIAYIVRGPHGYQAWDAVTGKPIRSLIAPQNSGSFTAAAVSPDGRYLAAVYNENAPLAPASLKPFETGEIRIWDLREGKLKWRLPGKSHIGPITWSDSLAFSPDATRLAVYRSLGDALSPAPALPAAGPRSPIKPLKMLSLEEGSPTPVEKELTKGGVPLPARVEWPADGRMLILRNARAFEMCDPATGQSQEIFKIPFPKSLADPTNVSALPPAPDAAREQSAQIVSRPPRIRFAEPTSSADDTPQDFAERQSTLSADGSRLAVHLVFVRTDTPRINLNALAAKGVAENRVAIWDVGTHRLLGIIRLPDEPWSQRERARRAADENVAKDRPAALALSGDGKRLAASDAEGTVHVYDINRLSSPESGRPGDAVGAGASSPQTVTAQTAFQDALQRARNRLLGDFDQRIDQLAKSVASSGGESGTASLANLKDEKQRFEKQGLIPWSEPMWKPVGEYLTNVAAAQAAVHAAISAADFSADLRDLADRQVVAHWKHRPARKNLVFYSNGKFADGAREHSWTFADGQLTLSWKNGSVAKCMIAPDGKSYSGVNQQNARVSGTYLNAEE